MKEITDKLAMELLELLNTVERFCDANAKEKARPLTGYDKDWLTAGCMCHSIRAHLYWHMQDMIPHPEPEAVDTPRITVIEWTKVSERPPEETCDINDLFLWCPDNDSGEELMLGTYRDGKFTSWLQVADRATVKREMEPSHWANAPHLGPDPKFGIRLLADKLPTNQGGN